MLVSVEVSQKNGLQLLYCRNLKVMNYGNPPKMDGLPQQQKILPAWTHESGLHLRTKELNIYPVIASR